jgi:hypothetical protein
MPHTKAKNKGLRKILLGGNGIGDVTNRVPFEMLLTNNRVLEELDIGNNEIGDATAKYLVRNACLLESDCFPFAFLPTVYCFCFCSLLSLLSVASVN